MLDCPRLRRYVCDKLRDGWSPEQIPGCLRLNFPHNGWMRVSPETIYTITTTAKTRVHH